jgi:hypothetical protein
LLAIWINLDCPDAFVSEKRTTDNPASNPCKKFESSVSVQLTAPFIHHLYYFLRKKHRIQAAIEHDRIKPRPEYRVVPRYHLPRFL